MIAPAPPQAGWLHKYRLVRVDGEPVPDGAEFFVLKLTYCEGDEKIDKAHVHASRMAALDYAQGIAAQFPGRSEQLTDYVKQLQSSQKHAKDTSGLTCLYWVSKADGSPVSDPGAAYLPLPLNIECGYSAWLCIIARRALKTYAGQIHHLLPRLASDIQYRLQKPI